MSESKVKLTWDGEKIRQQISVEDAKFTPKQILDSLDHARAQIEQMKGQKVDLESNMRKLDENIQSARKFEFDRSKFEEKCLEICKDKLSRYITEISPDVIKEAEKEAQALFDLDPNAYNENQKINQKYVLYQKKLATNKKVSENISVRLIKELLFESPIFDNPFK